MQSFAPAALFIGFAVMLLILSLFTRYRQSQVPPIPVEEQEHFVPAIPETQVNLDFDPRTEEHTETTIEEIFPDDMTEDVVEHEEQEEVSDVIEKDESDVEPSTEEKPNG